MQLPPLTTECSGSGELRLLSHRWSTTARADPTAIMTMLEPLAKQSATKSQGEPPMNRREFLSASAALQLAYTLVPATARAQAAYPSRNITMIVPFPAGGQAD